MQVYLSSPRKESLKVDLSFLKLSLFVCCSALQWRVFVSLRTMLSKNESILVEFTSLIVAVFEGISVECTSPISSLSVTQFTVEDLE